MSDQELMARARLAQEYTLPSTVRLALDANVQQSTAIAIVLTLLASALVSLAQTIATAPIDTSSPSGQALRWFTYSAIILSLSGAFLALITIKMCSDLPLAAQQSLVDGMTTFNVPISANLRPDWITPDSDNIPFAATSLGKGVLSTKILGDHFLLLKCFGMSKWYKIIVRTSSWILIAACVCTFAAFTFWMFLSEQLMTAELTMITFGLMAIIVMCVFVVGGAVAHVHR